MICLLQRVLNSSVSVSGERVGAIDQGLLVLVGIQPEDDQSVVLRMINRLLNYRVFKDEAGKMNLSLKEVNGGLLLVPQFTLAADTGRGRRPSFTTAAPPELGKELFNTMVDIARQSHDLVESGQFGADMQVHLINDGPVTFILD
ncbi:MAG: D-tyrosyl-tRNA(Tyr) deacylase [Gammaproteobacteria bacterium]|jgi:D-tyrosyl-tRNA(Tyr) deacylase